MFPKSHIKLLMTNPIIHLCFPELQLAGWPANETLPHYS